MRYALVFLHRYAGLALGLFLLTSGLTGSVIVFSKAIDGFLNPGLLSVVPQATAAGIDEVLENIRQSLPGEEPTAINLPAAPGDAVEVLFKASGMRVYADPHTGAVLGSRHGNDSLTGFLIDLHVHLLAGKTGEEVMGWIGLGGMALAIAGLILWWPKEGKWRQAFSVKWSASAFRVWFDLHRVAGVLVLVFLLMTTLTGAALALFDKITEPVLIALTGKGARQPAPRSLPGKGQGAPLGPMLEQAAALFPGAQVTRITLPARPDAAVGVRMRLAGEVHQFGRSFVWFDQYRGSVLRVDNALTAHRAVQIQSWLFPLHTGTWGGSLTRWLQVLAGLSLAMLTVSGAWLWIRRFRARRETARLRAAAS